jgi:hypothetical protein
LADVTIREERKAPLHLSAARLGVRRTASVAHAFVERADLLGVFRPLSWRFSSAFASAE